MVEKPKKTKKQIEADRLLTSLEFDIDDLLNDLRGEIEKEGLKKKHRSAISELSFLIRGAKSRLWPSTGPLKW